VLEPDYIDTAKTAVVRGSNGREAARIINGVEFDAVGRRVAYWLFPEHPGSESFFADASRRVRAEDVIHVFKQQRPGQVRGVSWFAPVVMTLKQWDQYTDAQLMKQLIAACLSVIVTDPDGAGTPLGVAEAGADVTSPELDRIGPGASLTMPPGREVTVVNPPRVGEFGAYSEVTLRTIAAGLGVNYEDLTGDYGTMSFSAARLSRLRHWARVEDWRWQLMIPQFCDPVWSWAMEVAAVFGRAGVGAKAYWTAPPLPMIEPDKEGLAYQRNVRSGIMSLSEALRERGYNPKTVLRELKSDFDLLDELGLVLDIDPRKMTQAGQAQSTGSETSEASDDEGDDSEAVAATQAAVVSARKRRAKMNGGATRR
jgi:lambda family phage portal protein